jgi:hypothetical protein
MEPEASVSQWILGAREGDSRAIGELWQRYFGRVKGESQIVPGTGSSSFGGLDQVLGDTPSPD